jgi:hypothetical protein
MTDLVWCAVGVTAGLVWTPHGSNLVLALACVDHHTQVVANSSKKTWLAAGTWRLHLVCSNGHKVLLSVAAWLRTYHMLVYVLGIVHVQHHHQC